MYCIFSGQMFLQPQCGAVRLVVSDGSAQMVQGGPTVSQRQPSRFCAAKGVKNQTWIVQDWLWIKLELTSLGWRRFSCLATGFFLFFGIIAAPWEVCVCQKLGAKLVLNQVRLELIRCGLNSNLNVSTTAEPWWLLVPPHLLSFLQCFTLNIAMTLKNTTQPWEKCKWLIKK